EDRTVRLWATAGGGAVAILRGHRDPIRSLAYSGDGRWLVSTSGDGTARRWAAGGDPQVIVDTGEDDYPVVFSPDGGWFASISRDRSRPADFPIRLWDAASGAPIASLHGHSMPVAALAASPDGRRLVSVARDGTARVWETATGRSAELLIPVVMADAN